MTDLATLAVGLLADDAPRNTGPDFGKAGPMGLLIVVLLMVGTFALIWSMNRHLKRLPERFDRGNPEPDQAADQGTAAGTVDLPADAPPPESEGTPHEPG